MRKAHLLLECVSVGHLDDFHLSEKDCTSLFRSGRKDPMASLKGCFLLLENPREKMFQGAA